MFIFNSLYDTLTVVLKPGRKLVVGAEVVREPGLRVEFKNGVFETEDADLAEALRAKIKGDKTVIEITSEDQRAFDRSVKAMNQRGPTTALDIKTDQEKVKIAEKAATNLQCPICDEKFKTQQAYNLHMVGHRAQAKAAAKAEEKPETE